MRSSLTNSDAAFDDGSPVGPTPLLLLLLLLLMEGACWEDEDVGVVAQEDELVSPFGLVITSVESWDCDWPRTRYGRLRCLLMAEEGGGGMIAEVEALFAFCPSNVAPVTRDDFSG